MKKRICITSTGILVLGLVIPFAEYPPNWNIIAYCFVLVWITYLCITTQGKARVSGTTFCRFRPYVWHRFGIVILLGTIILGSLLMVSNGTGLVLLEQITRIIIVILGIVGIILCLFSKKEEKIHRTESETL